MGTDMGPGVRVWSVGAEEYRYVTPIDAKEGLASGAYLEAAPDGGTPGEAVPETTEEEPDAGATEATGDGGGTDPSETAGEGTAEAGTAEDT